jgi:hypothetical protein
MDDKQKRAVSAIERSAQKFKQPLARPDWLKTALPQEIRKLELMADGRWPQVIQGWGITVACLRLLRCVYGSDVATLHELQRHVIDNMEATEEYEKHFGEFPDGCQDSDCALCMDIREEAKHAAE